MTKKPKMLKAIVIFFLLFILFIVASGLAQSEKPTNIILYIGDGMGLSQVTAGRIAEGTLNLDKFPTIGLVTTHSSDDLITDSAAAMTAMATGAKSYNKAISVSPTGDTLRTFFEYAKEKGMSTGMVVTCTVTHATPACCVAHVDDRNKHDQIAEQISSFAPDVLIGGGLQYFLPKSNEESKRKDQLDLIAKLREKMTVCFSPEEMRKNANATKLAVFLAQENPPTASERPYELTELTDIALKILSKNPKGFLLLVEGSQIDWGGHDNNAKKIVNEMVDFDNAVGAGFEFSKNNPKTLVVVTSDHETGGFAIHGGSISEKKVSKAGFTRTKHTGTMVPLFATGPGNEAFAGIIDNTDIGKHIIRFIRE